jgi:hypothetical protein
MLQNIDTFGVCRVTFSPYNLPTQTPLFFGHFNSAKWRGYLEDRETGLRESVKMRSGAGTVGKFSSENLHSQQREYEDEEEENN